MSANPFFSESTLPYHAPDFRIIKFEHYEPAIERGMQEHQEEIDAIASSTEPPTFENTVVRLEESGALLERTLKVFTNLCAANTSSEMQELESKLAPKLSAHEDSVYLNEKLFTRIKTVASLEGGRLEGEDKRLLEILLRNFVVCGAELSEEGKKELMEINQRLATLETAFGNALLDARKTCSLVVEKEEELAGLSPEQVATCKADAARNGYPEGTFLLLLVNTVQQPLMEKLTSRRTRQRLLDASLTRASQPPPGVNTEAMVREMLLLRLKKAKLMGFKNFAEWKLQDQMATPASAKALLTEVSEYAVRKAEEEAKEIQAYMKDTNAGHPLESHDWCYYQELVRSRKYTINEDEVRPYLELFTVLEKGVFYTATELYGLRFQRRMDIPTYDPDVRCYEVFDHDDSPLALFCLDPYARENKRGGAWMTDVVSQTTRRQRRPVIYNVLNVEKPLPGQPALLSNDHLRTMFHEFGHALHGMLAMQKYSSLSGTSVSRDFVEFPSQINEKWALEDTVLRHYALHYETKAPIPDALVQKLKASERFGVGFHTTELMKASVIDMEYHLVEEEGGLQPVTAMESATLAQYHLSFPLIPPRYTSSIFAHIFAGGYSCGYYAYTWAKVLDCAGFDWFLAHGGLTRENGDHFRKTVLSVGNAVDSNTAFKNFTGSDPNISAYLRLTGLKD